MRNISISASLLSCNHANLGLECKKLIKAGVNRIHLDMMDNHYVNNLGFSILTCKDIKSFCLNKPIDIHLMIKPINIYLIKKLALYGADTIYFHPDSTNNINYIINTIKKFKCVPGIVLSSQDNIKMIYKYLDKINKILIMSVEIGFSGNKFIKSICNKIKKIQNSILNFKIDLHIDGGIKTKHIKKLYDMGLNNFVIGSGITGNKNYKVNINKFKNIIYK